MSRPRIFTARTLVLGGIACAAAAVALKNRSKVAGLIGARAGEPEPYSPPSTPVTPSAASATSPPIANYDAPGPPANTATRVPAPEPIVHEGAIDEAAEEAAAAAEAANIGGPAPEYAPSTLDERVDEADRPLEESGEGVSEGLEQAEADLEDNAEATAGDPNDGERSIEDAIEAQDDPTRGEVLDEAHDHIHDDELPTTGEAEAERPGASTEPAPLQPETIDEGAPVGGGTATGTTDPDSDSATSAAEKSSAVWRHQDEAPTEEQPAVSDDDDGSEWQTWSGRAVDR